MKKKFVFALLSGVVIASSVAFLTPNCTICELEESGDTIKLAACNCGKPKKTDKTAKDETTKVAGCNCGKPKGKGNEVKKT